MEFIERARYRAFWGKNNRHIVLDILRRFEHPSSTAEIAGNSHWIRSWARKPNGYRRLSQAGSPQPWDVLLKQGLFARPELSMAGGIYGKSIVSRVECREAKPDPECSRPLLPIAAQVPRRRPRCDRSQEIGELPPQAHVAGVFLPASIATYQSRYFVEKRWLMPW